MASGSEAAGGASEEAAGVSSPRPDQEAAVSSLKPDQAEASAAAPGQPVVAGEDEPAAEAPPPSPAPAPAAAAAVARPYYECVFCKRGFTTAQALGGHMNIHRRDRAKPPSLIRGDPTSTPTSVFVRNLECYSQQYHPGYEYPLPPVLPVATQPGSSSNLTMYYRGSAGPATTTGSAAVVAGEAAGSMNPSSSGTASPRELSLFAAAPHDHDLHLGLGSFHGRAAAGGGEPEEALAAERQGGEPAERDQLDLELRLGRRPRH
ncbi:hypothetical protein BRADI_2g31850v3 [Brachypodium distachyon]|uniref:C2H2-type domain-containing protein n=1 Tax=Brachypodium distachyon TaxID=15368 RepID=A0A0Q3MRQ5_BRADI|nr:hypothetical protein BRADI_2g31850v3 [Brachypodium distachyon]